MRDVYDYAKYFIKSGMDSKPNTFDGNMKLQKMLVFADFANICINGVPLFGDEVLAFEHGCVVEKVRIRYKNDYAGLKKDSDAFQPDFTQDEYDILNMTNDIFGKCSAKELSEINHEFTFWESAYKAGIDVFSYHIKSNSVVRFEEHEEDVARMLDIIEAYKQAKSDGTKSETINDVVFYYEGFELTDEIIEELAKFAASADDDTYTVYKDDGKLVIY